MGESDVGAVDVDIDTPRPGALAVVEAVEVVEVVVEGDVTAMGEDEGRGVVVDVVTVVGETTAVVVVGTVAVAGVGTGGLDFGLTPNARPNARPTHDPEDAACAWPSRLKPPTVVSRD